MKICVIIPTFNEAKAIFRLVQDIRRQELPVVVIDDGSSDDTAEIARKAGAIVLVNPQNQGKGASLVRGFNYAMENGFSAVITMDGDGQHLPEDIPFFLRIAKYSQSALLIGNRMTKTKNMPWVRVLTNQLMSSVISRIAKQKVPDTQCGFRLIKKEALEKVRLKTSKYEIESEMILGVSRQGFKIESVPIKTVYADEKSQINPVFDTLRFIKFIIGELWISRR